MENKDITVSSQALQMAKLEIDTQIATAKQFPRDIARFKRNAMAMIEGDRELAASCTYHLTRTKKEGGQVVIEGPSIRLAEVGITNWGNIRCGGRINGVDDKWVYAQAFAHDLENNVRIEVEVKRRITGKGGYKYSDDMIQTTGAAAIAIAIRNAVFKGIIPFSFVRELQKHAQKCALGPDDRKEAEKEKWIAYFENVHGVARQRIFDKFGAQDAHGMTDENFHTLMGINQSLRENSTTVENEFPIRAPEALEDDENFDTNNPRN